jgi:uncharacterized membrane protein YfcA
MGLLLRVVAGFGVALVCTPAGVSGAFLLLPVQVLFFGAPSPSVTATNLLYNVVSTPAGAIGFHRGGRLDRSLALALCWGTAPGVVIGVVLRSTVLAERGVFAWVAATVLVLLGLRLFFGLGAPRVTEDDGWNVTMVGSVRLLLLGLVAGTIGGIYGIGGAAVVVPWLVAVERVPMSSAAGAGLVTTLLTSVVGLATFVGLAAADVGSAAPPQWTYGLALGIGGAVGAYTGARLQPRLPVTALRMVLGVAALAAGMRLLVG